MSQPPRFRGFWHSENSCQMPSQDAWDYWGTVLKEQAAEKRACQYRIALEREHWQERVYHLGLTLEQWLAVYRQYPAKEARVKRLQETRWCFLPQSVKDLLEKKGVTDYEFPGFDACSDDPLRLQGCCCYVRADGFVYHFTLVSRLNLEWRCVEVTSEERLKQHCHRT